MIEGSYRPLDRPTARYDDQPVSDACVTDGIRAFAELLGDLDDVAIVGVAPLTPLGCIGLTEPEALESVTDVVVLMGLEADTPLEINGIDITDFNFGVDVAAAEVVFDQTDVPITLIIFETSSSSLATTDQIDDLAGTGPVGDMFADLSRQWVETWTSTLGEDGIHPWDANTVWWLLRPDAFDCDETSFVVDVPDDDPGSVIDDPDAHLYVGDQYDGRPVTACTGYADDEARTEFVSAVVDALGT